MKKYLISVLLITLYLTVFSQVPQSRILLGQDTLTKTGGRVYKDTLKTLVCSGCVFNHGSYSDTIVITAAGGGGNNIYNTDSTLSANRTVSMAGHQLTFSSNAGARLTVSNSLSSTFALSEILNNSSNGLQFGSWGTTETTAGLVHANYSFLNGNGTDAMVIQNLNASQPIIFGINTVEQARFDGTKFQVAVNLGVTGTSTHTGQAAFNGSTIETYTLPSSPTGVTEIANYFNVTTAGSSSSLGPINLYAPLNAGYTGNQESKGIYTNNAAAGTANSWDNTNGYLIHGNYGVLGITTSAAGANIGTTGMAYNSTYNVGGFFTASLAKNSGTNVGLMAFGLNTGTSPTEVAAYFGSQTSASVAPTLTSSVVTMNNGSEAIPILLLQSAGTTVSQFNSSGQLTIGNSTAGSFALNTNGSTTSYHGYYQAGTLFGLTGISSGSGNGIAGANSGDFVVRNSQRMIFSTDGGTTLSEQIDGSGNFSIATGKALLMPEGSNGRVGQTTLVSGVKVLTISGLTTSSRAFPGFVAQGGTSTGVFQYSMVCTANTLTITAVTVAGVTVTTDASTVNYFIIN